MITFVTLVKNDIKLFLRDWKAVILLLVLPVLFICLFVYALSPYLKKSSFVDPFSIALVDNENSSRTKLLTQQLNDFKIFKEILKVDENQARALLSEDKISAILIIPNDFSRSLYSGENKPVNVIGNKNHRIQSDIAKNVAISAANLVSAGQCAINTIYDYNQKAGLKGKELQKEFYDSTMAFFVNALARNEIYTQLPASASFNLTSAEYFTAALMVIFLMFAGMPGMKMLVNERSMGITRRLGTSPVRLWQVILSKFLVSFILSLIQFAIIVIFTSFVFKNYWGAPLKNIILLFMGVIFSVSAWSVFVSSIAKSPASADVIGNLGILVMAIVGGSIYPLNSMPELIRNLSKFTINRWATDGFIVLFSGDKSLSITTYVYALMLIGFVLMAVSMLVMRFRRSA